MVVGQYRSPAHSRHIWTNGECLQCMCLSGELACQDTQGRYRRAWHRHSRSKMVSKNRLRFVPRAKQSAIVIGSPESLAELLWALCPARPNAAGTTLADNVAGSLL